MQTLSDFIEAHIGDDPVKLALNRAKYPEVDVKTVVETLLSREKLKNKLPGWYAQPRLILPYSLSAEQCSGEEMASYKAELAGNLIRMYSSEIRIADLTGGLGSDCAAFSKVADEVLYNEMSPLLCQSVEHNFAVLGIDNCLFSNAEVKPGAVKEILGGFAPSLIYLDPARRSDKGGKVYHIEDCSPDVSLLKEELLEASPLVMIKLSPMADISLVLQKMGDGCREVHIAGTAKECKELLLVIQRGYRGDCSIIVDGLRFTLKEERSAVPVFAAGAPAVGDIILEPVKKVMKAAPFNLLSARFGLEKFDRSTHMYIDRKEAHHFDRQNAHHFIAPMTSHQINDFEQYGIDSCGSVCDKSPKSTYCEATDGNVAIGDAHACGRGLFRRYEVVECMELNGRNIKDVGRRYPKADVVSHNTPVSSDELAKRLKCSSGNEYRIMALHLGSNKSNLLVVTEQL